MLERFGIEKGDIRKLQIVVIAMTLIMAFLIEGPVVVRVIVGFIMALIAGASFLVVTVLMNKFGPDGY